VASIFTSMATSTRGEDFAVRAAALAKWSISGRIFMAVYEESTTTDAQSPGRWSHVVDADGPREVNALEGRLAEIASPRVVVIEIRAAA